MVTLNHFFQKNPLYKSQPHLFFPCHKVMKYCHPKKENPNCYMMITETPDAFQGGIRLPFTQVETRDIL
jgi:hypothetical protein